MLTIDVIHQEGSMVTCAVKSLNDHAGLKERIEFLREASTMEACRLRTKLSIDPIFVSRIDPSPLTPNFLVARTEHVVKLIGMVTKSQPVLVLMEFMENGDLQNFLRKRRLA